MMEQHFTAWITSSAYALDTQFCDVLVLRDKVVGYRDDSEDNEIPVYESDGEGEIFYKTLTIAHDDEDQDRLMSEAQQALTDAGWQLKAEWQPVDTGYIATVERD